jgi:hypothetical protein
MKKLVAAKSYLSIALAVAAFATLGSVSASAQALSHDGSLLPHYFDKSGELKWGSWGEQQTAAPVVVHHQALRPTRQLIQNAGRSAHTQVQ